MCPARSGTEWAGIGRLGSARVPYLTMHSSRSFNMPLIVVTGASQGIGQAIAEAFACQPDVRLALLARSESRLEAVALRCRQLGAKASACPCDVTDEQTVQRVASQILEHDGAPDVVVNNAGQFRPSTLLETTAPAFREQLAVNLTGAFMVTQAFAEVMVARRRGHFFFIASVASLRAYVGGAAYCAAKHGLLGLARVVREEMKAHGVRVTTLLPGAVRTPSWDGTDLPEERFMAAGDIANTLVSIWNLGARTVVEEVVIRPQLGDI